MSETTRAPRSRTGHAHVGHISARAWKLLLGVTLAGAALRLFGLARYGLWYDEGTTMYAAQLAAVPSRLFNPDWLTEPPFLPFLLHLWGRLLEGAGVDLARGAYRTDFLMRLVPCVFGIASVPLGFALARRLGHSTATGLVAAFFIAVSPLQVFYAQELRPYSTMVLLVLAALYFFRAALDSDAAVHWSGFTILIALATYNHFFTVWYIASLGLAACILFGMRRRVSLKWAASQIVLLLLIIPALKQGFAINRVIQEAGASWYPPVTIKTGLFTFETFFAGYSPSTWAHYPLFVLGIAWAVLGAWSLRRHRESLVLLLVIALVPIAGNIALWSMRRFSYYEHRLFIVCGIAVFILMASGVAAMRHRPARAVALSAWCALTAPCLLDYYAQNIHPDMEHRLGVRYKIANRDVANEIRDAMRAGDVVGEFSHVTHFPLKYYLPQADIVTLGFTNDDRAGMLASYPHESVWEHAGALPHRIDTVAAHHTRMWYVDSWWEPFEMPPWHRYYRPWLLHHGVVEFDRAYFGVRLTLFDFAAMRARSLHVERLVDSGGFALVRCVDATGRTAGLEPDLQYDAPGTVTLVYDPRTGEATIRNRTATREDFECRLFESADAIEPLSFNRLEPETDVWRPVVHGDPAFVDNLDPIKMAATLQRGTHDSGTLFADVSVRAGHYAAYAYIWSEAGASNTSRATLEFRFDTGAGERRGAAGRDFIPYSKEGQSGWSWQRVAAITAEGTPVRAFVTARRPETLTTAHADLGRIVFVPETRRDVPSSVSAVYASTVSVEAGGAKSFQLAPHVREAARYDLRIEDKSTRMARSVNWYVPAPG